MSWRKLAIVQLAQNVFAKKSAKENPATEVKRIEPKEHKIVEKIDEIDKTRQQQATLKKKKEPETNIKSSNKSANENEKSSIKRTTGKKSLKQKPQKKEQVDKNKVSKKEQKLKLYHDDIKKHLGSVDDAFLEIIVKNLGPCIYNKDAESVACSDPKELDTVKKNFLVKKLQMPKENKDALDKAVAEVCEKLKDTKTKYRATFYYMLAKNLKKESMLS